MEEIVIMKSRWYFICSIFQVVVGLTAIVAFVVLAINGEMETRWIITLLLAIAFVAMGVVGIIDNKR